MKTESPTAAPPTTSSAASGSMLPGKLKKIASILAVVFGAGFAATSSPASRHIPLPKALPPRFIFLSLGLALCTALLFGSSYWAGGKRVVEFAGKVVPFMIVAFVLGALGIVLANFTQIPAAFALFSKAPSPELPLLADLPEPPRPRPQNGSPAL